MAAAGKPRALEITIINSSSVALKWTAPGAPVTGYTIEYRRWNNSDQNCQTLQVGTRTYTNITGLQDSSMAYEFRVAALQGDVTRPFSDPVRPGKPRALEITIINSSSVALKWTAPGIPVTGYTIEYRRWNNSDQNCQTLQVGTRTYTNITGLQDSLMAYEFRVAALQGDVTRPFSDPVRPGKPRALEITITNSSSVALKWTAPGAPVTGYTIEYRRWNNSDQNCQTLQVGTRTYTNITGLQDSLMAYEFRVAAVQGDVTGPFSDPVRPGKPRALEITIINSSSVALKWTAPGAPVTGYTIEYRRWNNSDQNCQTLQVGTRTYTNITGLQDSSRAYEFRVAAVQGNVTGPFSDPVRPSLYKIRDPEITSIGGSSVTLKWTAPGTHVTGYKIQYRRWKCSNQNWQTLQVRTCRRTINGLQDSSMAYEFCVAAVQGDVTGPFSDPVCHKLWAPEITSIRSTLVELEWTAPQTTVTGYKIQYRRWKGSNENWQTTPMIKGTTFTIPFPKGCSDEYEFCVAAVQGRVTGSFSDPVPCSICRDIHSQNTAAITLKSRLDDLVNKGQETLQEFYKYVNGFLNDKGGTIVIHACNLHALERFDHKVDDKLNKLIPDGSLYQNKYERSYFDRHHLVYRIKPAAKNRPLSTLDFKTKVSINKGIELPSYTQMEFLIDRFCEDDESSDDSDSECEFIFKEGEEVFIKMTTWDEPFQENLRTQAKFVPTTSMSPDYCWYHLKEYISSFTKIRQSCSICFGVREEERIIGNAFQPRKTGKFLTVAIELSEQERDNLKDAIERKANEELKWVGQEEPRQLLHFAFHPVENAVHPDCCVLEIKIAYYHGLCFHDKEGPELYRCEFQSSGYNGASLARITYYKWVKSFRGNAHATLEEKSYRAA